MGSASNASGSAEEDQRPPEADLQPTATLTQLGPGKWCWVYGGEPKLGSGSTVLFFWTGTREGAWVQANDHCQRRAAAEGPLVPFVDLAVWHPGAGDLKMRLSDGEHHTLGGATYCPICRRWGLPPGDP